MTAILIRVDARSTAISIGEGAHSFPVGPALLTESQLHADPPRPEELTNAIGLVADHLDDLARAEPALVESTTVQVCGPEMNAIASVEAGHHVDLPFTLTREAVEDVFRTLATEPAAARARNPGLDTAMVHTVVGGCCVLVTLIRRLHLESVEVVA